MFYNEKEYLKKDAERLLQKYYEKYVRDGEVVIPDFLTVTDADKVVVPTTMMVGMKPKSLGDSVAVQIMHHVECIAMGAVYFDGKKDVAKKIIEMAFTKVNNVRFDQSCSCSYAESLGRMANMVGLSELANRFRYSTYCPNSPEYSQHFPTTIETKGETHTPEEIEREILRNIWWVLGQLRRNQKTE